MKKNKFKVMFSVILLLLIGVAIRYTLAVILENDVEVEKNSNLTYYLNVKYDGIDVLGRVSSDEVVSEVNSGIIYVEDKIPEGLTFDGFVTTDDGTIGSVERNNSDATCLGKVIDDTNESGNVGVWNNNNTEYTYHGLHYDATTRTVSFQVKNLKAGCVLTVGIKTITPTSVDDPNTLARETRRDFYNYGSVSEKIVTAFSNVVHVYMGKSDETLYTVTYEYESGTSNLAPSLPQTTSYAAGSTVGVAPNIYFEGYEFNGWTSNDVTITDGKFTMPNSNVTIKGSFTQANEHSVTYTLSGTVPNGFEVPSVKNHFTNSIVDVDSLSSGDVFNGYRFNGWTSNNVVIDNGAFTMPDQNVTITGSFTPITYNVSYQFIGNDMPENSNELLPLARQYSEGDVVVLSNMDDVSGYKFLGWFKEDGFIMPSKNVIVSGEWKRFNGEFEPTITITTLSNKSYYRLGDKVQYKITITNPESYPITNVIIKENSINANFKVGEGYTIDGKIATIDSIDANDSIDLYAEYQVLTSDVNTITNEVELKGAFADNYYELKSQEYIATATNNLQSKLKICADITGVDVGNYFKFKIYNNNFENWIKIKKDECTTLFVDPGTYKIFELVPQEYNVDSITGGLSTNDGQLTIVQGTNYEITFNNKFKSKKFMHSFGDLINIIQGGE